MPERGLLIIFLVAVQFMAFTWCELEAHAPAPRAWWLSWALRAASP
jgi:hypothetical protein